MEPESIKLDINGRIVKISANPRTIQLLRVDDGFLQNYVLTAAKRRQFSFIEPESIECINIKRVDPPEPEQRTPTASPSGGRERVQVWCKKGKPNGHDAEATAVLIRLRSVDYKSQFEDKRVVKNKIWQEIAQEMQRNGFDVDSSRCQQKFLNLTKSYLKYFRKSAQLGALGGSNRELKPPDFFAELHDVLRDKVESMMAGGEGQDEWSETITIRKEEDDPEDSEEAREEVAPKKMKLAHHDYSRPKSEGPHFGAGGEDEGGEVGTSDLYLEKCLTLMEERTKLMRERNKQRRQFLDLFQKLVDKI